MIRKFFITLASSWLLSPLSVMVAHVGGFGSSNELLVLLLTMAASAPFQLLLNDSVAVSNVSGKYRVTHQQLILILTLQFICALIALIGLSSRKFATIDIMFCSFFLSASTLVSFYSVCKYYQASLDGSLTHRNAMVYGAIPGVTNISFYSLIAVGSQATDSPFLIKLLFISPFLAAMTQYAFARTLFSPISKQQIHKSQQPSTINLFIHLLVLLFLAATATYYRDSIAIYSSEYGAFILVFLNILGTSINTMLKGKFLNQNSISYEKSKISFSKVLLIVSIFSAAAAVIMLYVDLMFAYLAIFLCLQLLICTTVESARKIA